MGNFMRDFDFKIGISLEEYDTLTESIDQATALTHVLSCVTHIDLLPKEVLRNYLSALNDLTFNASHLCDSLKTEALENSVEM